MATENEPTPPAKPDDEVKEAPAAAQPAPAPPSSASASLGSAVDELRANQADDDEIETTLWKGGYSPKAMIGTWILCAIVSVALIALAISVEWFTFVMALIAVAILWVIVGGIYGYRKLGVAYELTNQRFIHQSGVLSRRTDRIEVIDIDDVSYKQGPVERILGVGIIDIESSDRSHPQLRMVGIDNVRDVSGMIDDIRRKERRRRSLHIEAI